MDKEHLIALLWASARLQAARFGRQFTEDCTPLMNSMIREGAVRVLADKFTPARALLAETTVGAFSLQMIIEAQAQGVSDLPPSVFHAAKNFFCPGFWPFC